MNIKQQLQERIKEFNSWSDLDSYEIGQLKILKEWLSSIEQQEEFLDNVSYANIKNKYYLSKLELKQKLFEVKG